MGSSAARRSISGTLPRPGDASADQPAQPTGHYFARGTMWVLSGMLFQQGMTYVNTALVLRFVDVAAYGSLVFVMGLAQLCAPLALQGLDLGAARFVAGHRAAGEDTALRSVFSQIKWLVLCGVAALSLLAPALYALVPGSFAARMSPEFFAICFAGFVLLAALASLNQQGLLGVRRPAARALSGFFIDPLLRLALILAWLPSHSSVADLAVVYLIPLGGAWLAGEGCARRGGLRLQAPRFDRTRELHRFGLPLIAVAFFHLVLFQSDRVLLGYLMDPRSVGLYSVPARIALLVIAPLAASGQVFGPIIAEHWTKRRMASLRQAYQEITAHFIFIVGALYALLVIHAGWILPLFGEEFAAAPPRHVLAILGAGLACAALPGPNGVLYRMSGKTRLAARVTAGAGLTNLGLNLVLIPRLGPVGAAAATAASVASLNLIALVLFRTVYRMQVHPFSTAWVAAAAGAVALASLAHAVDGAHEAAATAAVGLAAGLWLAGWRRLWAAASRRVPGEPT